MGGAPGVRGVSGAWPCGPSTAPREPSSAVAPTSRPCPGGGHTEHLPVTKDGPCASALSPHEHMCCWAKALPPPSHLSLGLGGLCRPCRRFCPVRPPCAHSTVCQGLGCWTVRDHLPHHSMGTANGHSQGAQPRGTPHGHSQRACGCGDTCPRCVLAGEMLPLVTDGWRHQGLLSILGSHRLSARAEPSAWGFLSSGPRAAIPSQRVQADTGAPASAPVARLWLRNLHVMVGLRQKKETCEMIHTWPRTTRQAAPCPSLPSPPLPSPVWMPGAGGGV